MRHWTGRLNLSYDEYFFCSPRSKSFAIIYFAFHIGTRSPSLNFGPGVLYGWSFSGYNLQKLGLAFQIYVLKQV